jgi:hypothetical protein
MTSELKHIYSIGTTFLFLCVTKAIGRTEGQSLRYLMLVLCENQEEACSWRTTPTRKLCVCDNTCFCVHVSVCDWASSLDEDTYAERLGEQLGRGHLRRATVRTSWKRTSMLRDWASSLDEDTYA